MWHESAEFVPSGQAEKREKIIFLIIKSGTKLEQVPILRMYSYFCQNLQAEGHRFESDHLHHKNALIETRAFFN